MPRAVPPCSLQRSLPLRVAPYPGEALDSWLDALAVRHQVSRRALLERCGIAAHPGYGSWMRLLEPADIDRIATITGYDPVVVAALTFSRTVHPDGPLYAAHTLPSTTWGWRAHSRWCPQCLTDTGGRWLLAWRLNWTFACLTHHRLLHDACPACAGRQRSRPPANQIPQLGRCAEPVRDPSGERTRCGADLGQIDESVELVDAATVRSQRLVNALLAGLRPPLRVYGSARPEPQDIFIDVTIIARYVFSHIDDSAAATSLSPELAELCNPAYAANGHKAAPAAHPTARDVAIATTIAVSILDAHDASAAVSLLADVILASAHAGTDRGHNHEALTAPVRLICERAQQSVRNTITRRRRFDATAAKSGQSTTKNRQARTTAREDSRALSSGTRHGR
ncbi:TniQ family protein [Mycolicibacterium austroafricanum]|uniref:TniQ family protein n=1 Tax=Mycolicibacterium austroafricanum TaxID=39687 RepID=UPI001F42A29D|nr:TniQ family protein [Mycolicibacterium austroafricanum]